MCPKVGSRLRIEDFFNIMDSSNGSKQHSSVLFVVATCNFCQFADGGSTFVLVFLESELTQTAKQSFNFISISQDFDRPSTAATGPPSFENTSIGICHKVG